MAKKIRNYLKQINDLLENPPENICYQEEMKKHLIQIQFFMHERLIHLIVTVTFAILGMITILYAITYPSIALFTLVIALFVLLIPYIKHYYLLENSVQAMYEQYDEMERRSRE